MYSLFISEISREEDRLKGIDRKEMHIVEIYFKRRFSN